MNWKQKYGHYLLFGLLLITFALGIYTSTTVADVGNHNSYSSGKSRSSSSSSGDGAIVWLILNLLLHMNGPNAVILLIIIAIGYISYRRNRYKLSPYTAQDSDQPSVHNVIDHTEVLAAQIRQKDPAFSANKFIEWSKEVFISLQMAWTKRDWKLARPFESDSLFKTHQQQLEEHIRNHRTNIIENICVNRAYLIARSEDAEYEYLIVYLEVRMNDYFIDDDTGNVIRGDRHLLYEMYYHLKFMRSIDVKTNPSTSNVSTTNCPNCGAPTDITSSGECKYCGSVITTGKYDWVLCEIVNL